ncbi:MAG: DUF5106 domain-containing protein [Prevotella sp.]|nr:DUF5106 domain-containing protein [Prevotella sp.]
MFRGKLFVRGLIFLSLVFLFCCFSNGNIKAQVNMPKELVQYELPLPEMPEGMTDPKERAAYILRHFWDEMDFSDTGRSHDGKLMEVNFVNFISLFPHADEQVLPPSVRILLNGVATDSIALNIITDLAEKYLSDPDSPMRSENYYIIFLEQLLSIPEIPEASRIRPASQLETARKNRPGKIASDFSYTTREGELRTLLDTESNMMLLIFYDPACPHCKDILDEVNGSLFLKDLIANNTIYVLAIYTEGDRQLWDDTKSNMPQTWTVGIDETGIVENSIYDLPAMPVMYLLDNSKTVLLKDPTKNEVEMYLSEWMLGSEE